MHRHIYTNDLLMTYIASGAPKYFLCPLCGYITYVLERDVDLGVFLLMRELYIITTVGIVLKVPKESPTDFVPKIRNIETRRNMMSHLLRVMLSSITL